MLATNFSRDVNKDVNIRKFSISPRDCLYLDTERHRYVLLICRWGDAYCCSWLNFSKCLAYVVKVVVSDVGTNYGSEAGCESYPVANFMCKTKEILAVVAMVLSSCIFASKKFFTNPTLNCTTSIWYLLSQFYWKTSLCIVYFSRHLIEFLNKVCHAVFGALVNEFWLCPKTVFNQR